MNRIRISKPDHFVLQGIIAALLALIFLQEISGQSIIAENMRADTDKEIQTRLYNFGILKEGSVMPRGWIRKQLYRDLTEGYIGAFDAVHPTVTHDVFVHQDRLSKRRFTLRKEWWSGEHEGYWKDAIVRMAFLTNQASSQEQAREWIYGIIHSMGKEGYIGIYRDCNKPDCRFHHERGNGELWTTSRILMAFLAYYEYTGDSLVLEAAEKATNLVMHQYEDKNYFIKPSRGGGVSHGVGFFEILEWLFRITGDEKYNDFAVKLYNDFNQGNFRDDDLKTANLLDSTQLFMDHGAHIAEGIFVPRYIAKLSESEKEKAAADMAIYKLEKHLTPGGAMRSDEWIKGREGTADERYEYCGIAEMIGPLNKLISFTGDLSLADRLETMTFNAGQGARFPVLTGLSYLTKDNRFKINHREIVKRESYDAAHPAAACCVLNGGRLMPYFVEGMWMKDMKRDGLVAVLFGPCELHTEIRGLPVHFIEDTGYPFRDHVTFRVVQDTAVEFPLTIRKPFQCTISDLDIPEGAKVIEENEECIVIEHAWHKGDVVDLRFGFRIREIPQPASKTVQGKGMYLKRGPLVYALPFEHITYKTKEHHQSGFFRYRIVNRDTSDWNLQLSPEDPFQFVTVKNDTLMNAPWETPVVKLTGVLRDNENIPHDVELVPMGNTIFRRVTFSVLNTN